MAKEWSENTKYNNPDIGGLVNNVKRMMGVDSGAAGRRSRTMQDILTGSKTEGQQLKNIGQQDKNVQLRAIADLVKRFMLNPELSDDQQYGRISSSGGDFGQYLKREALLEGEKDEQAAKVALAREKLGRGSAAKRGELAWMDDPIFDFWGGGLKASKLADYPELAEKYDLNEGGIARLL